MKRFTILIAATFIGSLAFAQNAEEEAIKKVVRAETDAYFMRDLAAWTATWQHNPKIKRTFIFGNGYSTTMGWDSAQAQMERDFKQNPNAMPVQVSTENYDILSSGTMAWVDYDQA